MNTLYTFASLIGSAALVFGLVGYGQSKVGGTDTAWGQFFFFMGMVLFSVLCAFSVVYFNQDD